MTAEATLSCRGQGSRYKRETVSLKRFQRALQFAVVPRGAKGLLDVEVSHPENVPPLYHVGQSVQPIAVTPGLSNSAWSIPKQFL